MYLLSPKAKEIKTKQQQQKNKINIHFGEKILNRDLRNIHIDSPAALVT